jgi:hypothetical protein
MGKIRTSVARKNSQSLTIRLLVTHLSSDWQGNLSDVHYLH